LVLHKEVDFEEYDQLFKSFWTATESYKLRNGFRKLGWDTEQPIEFWFAKNVCLTLIKEVDQFKNLTEPRELVSKLTWRT